MQSKFCFPPLLSALLLAATTTLPSYAALGRLGAYSARQTNSLTSRLEEGRQGKQRAAGRRRKHLIRALGHLGKSLVPRAASSSRSHTAVAKHSNFIWEAPIGNSGVTDDSQRDEIASDFINGRGERHSPAALLEANVFASAPLHGGIYARTGSVKYIILHSTETGRPADAQRVVASWNRKGLRHPGAQFVVDRDGTIYNTVDPSYATVHVNQFKTLAGVNNDNSIGIEIVHTGKQVYSDSQVQAVARLVQYLQNRFAVSDNHVYTHHYVQPSDRSDPVNFDWERYTAFRLSLVNSRTAYNGRIGSSSGAFGKQESPAVSD